MALGEEPGEGTPFNMAMLYYISLRRLIDEKNKAKINNNLQGWFHGLQAIADEIDFKMNKDDKKLVKDKFKDCEDYLNANVERSMASQLIGIIMSEVPPILREIDRKLMEIMNKNNMIFPRIEGNRGIESLRKGYGLKEK